MIGGEFCMRKVFVVILLALSVLAGCFNTQQEGSTGGFVRAILEKSFLYHSVKEKYEGIVYRELEGYEKELDVGNEDLDIKFNSTRLLKDKMFDTETIRTDAVLTVNGFDYEFSVEGVSLSPNDIIHAEKHDDVVKIVLNPSRIDDSTKESKERHYYILEFYVETEKLTHFKKVYEYKKDEENDRIAIFPNKDKSLQFYYTILGDQEKFKFLLPNGSEYEKEEILEMINDYEQESKRKNIEWVSYKTLDNDLYYSFYNQIRIDIKFEEGDIETYDVKWYEDEMEIVDKIVD